MTAVIPSERIAQKIYFIRDQKVMLDSDLAEFYGVRTAVLNQAVKRNRERFPEDFVFSLSGDEIRRMSQIVTSSKKIKFSKSISVFTEHGVAMLASVLRSEKAALVSVSIIRAFIRMREYLATHKQILEKLKKHDENFVIIYDVLKQLTERPKEGKKRYGFNS